jgi:hypothetical protein
VADGQWAKASQFCLLDFPIVELEGKPSACSATANWAARWRGWPKPSACAC